MDTPLTRGERTRQAILTAAYSLFVEQGYRATSMRQIANRSNTSLSGIYNHFESKEHIFETVVMEHHPFHRMLQILQDTPGETMEEFIGNAAQLIISELRGHPDSLNLVLIGITEFKGKQAPELAGVYLPQFLALFERFSGAQGRLRDLPLQAILISFVSTVFACYLSANLTNPGGSNLPELEPQLDILYNGIMKAEKPCIHA
ncbi:MAG: putative TetR family transcriptional regulator [Chloroflexi bacterium]|nr:putative TetR family transcriptional regulator [Chloroflexota bacterium]